MNAVSQNAFISAQPLEHAPGTLAPAGFADSIRFYMNDGAPLTASELIKERDQKNITYGQRLGGPGASKAETLAAMVGLLDALRNGRKIEAIKIVREMTGMGLKEAKDWVEGLQSQIPTPVPAPVQNYKRDGFLVLTQGPDDYGGSCNIAVTESYRDDAERAAKSVLNDAPPHREVLLVEVIGRTKPVFSML
ncbi:50S ribosomal protein L7/L12 [uncultured Methylobacterium sp.]|mgnify:CR=1 FL=1|jgi:hypothetical protein|uniref:ribosomal protein bL12 n=1 Tax=uncultured Methylobacterium sp. TaxID=157278 RepID=UPI002638412F|nr:50S ribosomal protein L7/L12 [uncultured Methylobacterium sp.]